MSEHPGNGTHAEVEGKYQGPRASDAPGADAHHDDPGYVTRTKFLSGVAIATGGVMSAAILVPVIGFAVVDPLRPEEFRWVDVGPLSDFVKNAPPYDTSGGKTPVVGTSSSIAVSGPAPESDRRAFVVFEQTRAKKAAETPAGELTAEDMEIIVIWNRCAHLGCPVTSGGGSFICPCHGGSYDSRGHVTAGPPPRPLDRFDWKITDGTADVDLIDALTTPSESHRLLIGKPYSIDSDEKPFKIKLPGEPVEGILANLYPF